MSEKQISSPEQSKEPPSPEQQRAFRGIYSHLMELTVKNGQPIVIKEKNGSNFYHYGSQFAKANNEVFNPNATQSLLKITDNKGGSGISWSTVLTEQAVKEYGVLARLEVTEEGKGTHPADVYWLYPNQSIEHVRRTAEKDGVDQDGEDINWREVNSHVGWLDVDQMHDLQLRIESADVISRPTG